MKRSIPFAHYTLFTQLLAGISLMLFVEAGLLILIDLVDILDLIFVLLLRLSLS